MVPGLNLTLLKTAGSLLEFIEVFADENSCSLDEKSSSSKASSILDLLASFGKNNLIDFLGILGCNLTSLSNKSCKVLSNVLELGI